ncbi:MAG: transcriptional repressor [Thermodesulfovibrionales bacterium]|nr:transcriptional repressor [Thermodesulfovibrionales bacterium]
MILKRHNLKVTPKRLAILEILSTNQCLMTPEVVWKNLKVKMKKIGLPTVYRNLEELSKNGIISKVFHPDRKLYYYFCKSLQHHHHFVCLSCQRVEEINFCNIEEIQRSIEDKLNSKVLSHIIQLNGLCSNCLAKKSERSLKDL